MAERFNFFKSQAQALGLTDPAEIKEYIREEQRIELDNLLKERDLANKLQMESQKIQGELTLAEQRLNLEKTEREQKMQIEKEEREKKMKLEEERLNLEKSELEQKRKLEEERLELEKLDRQRKLDLEQEKLKIETEKNAEESKRISTQAQLDNEFRHAEAQRAFEIQRLEAESRNNFQHEVSNRESETQIRIAEIQASASNTNMSGTSHNNPNLSCKEIRDMPPLRSIDREQIDIYFSFFDRMCKLNNIPENKYCSYIASKLPAELLQILTRMSIEDGQNFNLFRENINRKYLLNGDYFRNKFYSLNLESRRFQRRIREEIDRDFREMAESRKCQTRLREFVYVFNFATIL